MQNWEVLATHASTLQASVNELLQKHNALQTFRDASEWDKDATAVIELLQRFHDDLNGYREGQVATLATLKQQSSQGSIFQRVLSSHAAAKEAKASIERADTAIQSITYVWEILYEMMDKTPSSKPEQKEIADELRQQKKELTLQKRELNESLRGVRANARVKTAGWTGVHGGLIGSVARYKRSSIRLDKERALIPYENQKAFIEGKLVALEKDLNWVAHFRSDGSQAGSQESQTAMDPEQIQRCSYCGRRIFSTDVCPGCGAVIQ